MENSFSNSIYVTYENERQAILKMSLTIYVTSNKDFEKKIRK